MEHEPLTFPRAPTLSWDAQVLVLTHEDATWTEQLPYMAARCAPVQVLECFGRAAKRKSPCGTEECVFNWWKDLSGVPSKPSPPYPPLPVHRQPCGLPPPHCFVNCLEELIFSMAIFSTALLASRDIGSSRTGSHRISLCGRICGHSRGTASPGARTARASQSSQCPS